MLKLLTFGACTILGSSVTDIVQLVKDSIGDPSEAAGHSSKPHDQSLLLTPSEKQRVIQYSSFELEHEEVTSD